MTFFFVWQIIHSQKNGLNILCLTSMWMLYFLLLFFILKDLANYKNVKFRNYEFFNEKRKKLYRLVSTSLC